MTRSCAPCELQNLLWTSSSILGENLDHTSLPRVFLWTEVTLGWGNHVFGLWVVTTPVPAPTLYHPSLHRKFWPLLYACKNSSHKSHVLQSGFYYRKPWRELAFRQFPREHQKSVPLGLYSLSCTCSFSTHVPVPTPASPKNPSSQVLTYIQHPLLFPKTSESRHWEEEGGKTAGEKNCNEFPDSQFSFLLLCLSIWGSTFENIPQGQTLSLICLYFKA